MSTCAIHDRPLECPECTGLRGAEVAAARVSKADRIKNGRKGAAARWGRPRFPKFRMRNTFHDSFTEFRPMNMGDQYVAISRLTARRVANDLCGVVGCECSDHPMRMRPHFGYTIYNTTGIIEMPMTGIEPVGEKK
jgi:hypothetical protein